MIQNLEVPENWERMPLDEVLIHVIGGDWEKSPDDVEDGYIPCVAPEALSFVIGMKIRG